MDILEKLYQNSGLLHVAEHVIGFLDNSTVAQCRLVSKESNEFLVKIWTVRGLAIQLKKAQELCEKKFETNKRMADGRRIKRSIFDLWPDWKVALKEIKSCEHLSDVNYLLDRYFPRSRTLAILRATTVPSIGSPLHFAARNSTGWYDDKTVWTRIFECLISTSLDFNVCTESNDTVLHIACQFGSKEVVEILLNNVVKKEINVQALNGNNWSIVQCAIKNTRQKPSKPVLKHLFDRRHEFDFDLGPYILHFTLMVLDESIETFEIMLEWAVENGLDVSEVDSDGENIFHLACTNFPEAALVMLECSDTYAFDRDMLASMANARNNADKRPIDILKRRRFPKTRIEKLTLELEKYTESTV